MLSDYGVNVIMVDKKGRLFANFSQIGRSPGQRSLGRPGFTGPRFLGSQSLLNCALNRRGPKEVVVARLGKYY
jgi:hypothetical protein